MTRRLTVDSVLPVSSRCWSRPSQTVGTPAEMVTPSPSRSSWIAAPSASGPGSTSFAPAMGAK